MFGGRGSYTSAMTIPHCTPGQWPKDLQPPRFAAHVHAGLPVGCQVALIGLPDDSGVRLNSGRIGAAKGPTAFRAALARYGVHEAAGWNYPKVYDAGDVSPASGHDEDSLFETHRRVFEAVTAVLDLGLFPIAIGGGHDLTYPFVHAVSKRNQPMTGIYFDAHLDVRPTVGSGMAFRRLVEDCGVRRLDAFGINPFVNAREHVEWFIKHGGHMHQSSATVDACLDGSDGPQRTLFVSFDLDVLDASHAPGVSAINPAGWTVREAQAAVVACGRSRAVKCFDLMELNPDHDVDDRTARIAAHLFLAFLRGYAAR